MLEFEELGSDDFVLEDDLSDDSVVKAKVSKNGKGEIWEMRIVDQWQDALHPMIEKYKLPSALCGVMTTSIAPTLASFESEVMSSGEVFDMVMKLRNLESFQSALENAGEYYHQDRVEYLKRYASEFETEDEKNHYLNDWIANYEISDFMRLKMKDPKVHFIRRIEKGTVKHEELRRVAEEKPFREYEFFVELFVTEEEKSPEELQRRLVTASEWRELRRSGVHNGNTFIFDTLGHFVLLKALYFRKAENEEPIPVLALLNTSKGLQIHKKKVMKEIFQMIFE
jgi:hypothetical protein